MPDRLRFGLISFLNIFGDAIRNYQINGDTNQAAAIALYGILSIIPLFILTLLVVGSLFSANPEIEQKLIEGIRQFIPSFSGELLFQFSHIEGKREVLGGVGIITLIWFSAMIFNAIETALDIIFRSKTLRNYFASKLLAIAMIPLGWAVGVASVGITYVATILSQQPFLGEGGLLYFPAIQGVLFRYLIPYVFTVLFFTIVYKAIPMAKVSLMCALIGSAILLRPDGDRQAVLYLVHRQLYTLQRDIRFPGGRRHPCHLVFLRLSPPPVLRRTGSPPINAGT